MGQSIQEWTKQNSWKTAFKKLKTTSYFLKAVFHKFYLVHSFEYFASYGRFTHRRKCQSIKKKNKFVNSKIRSGESRDMIEVKLRNKKGFNTSHVSHLTLTHEIMQVLNQQLFCVFEKMFSTTHYLVLFICYSKKKKLKRITLLENDFSTEIVLDIKI